MKLLPLNNGNLDGAVYINEILKAGIFAIDEAIRESKKAIIYDSSLFDGVNPDHIIPFSDDQAILYDFKNHRVVDVGLSLFYSLGVEFSALFTSENNDKQWDKIKNIVDRFINQQIYFICSGYSVEKKIMPENVSKCDIPKIAMHALQDLHDKSGSILYSSHETIQQGSIYLMGLNPGGIDGPVLAKNIETLLTRTTNAFLDEAWENGSATYEAGKAPLQERISWLLENLGCDPRNVIATNLIFVQSRDANGISYSLADHCWPVHKALLSIVKPKLILAFGNSGFSPYGYIHQLYGGEQFYEDSGHGDWSLKSFVTDIEGHIVSVVGLPHLSRYQPIGKSHVIDWIKKRM